MLEGTKVGSEAAAGLVAMPLVVAGSLGGHGRKLRRALRPWVRGGQGGEVNPSNLTRLQTQREKAWQRSRLALGVPHVCKIKPLL